MKFKKILIALLSLLMVCLLAGGGLLYTRLRFTDYTAYPLPESDRELSNPYTGWYQIHGYLLADNADLDLSGVQALEYGPGLALLQFSLQNYPDTPISEAGLAHLDEILDAWQSTGRQLIVRFLYDWDGDVTGKEPAELLLVKEHMTQTAEILNRYASSIYILQGIYLGAWGEMHSSPLLTQENMIALISHLDQILDQQIYLAVRTPEQWRTIVQSQVPLSGDAAFSGSLSARLGLFNDGMLGSVTDTGTYAEPGSQDTSNPYTRRSRQQEIAFQNQLCTYVPNGGEVILDNPYNDFSQAVADLSATHVSYLNSLYDEAVLSKWRDSVYHGAGSFDGMNGYDYIGRHLGYRYVLRSSQCLLPSPLEEEITCSIWVENVGFANSYRSFDVSLILESARNGELWQIPISADTRLWEAGARTLLEVSLNSHDYSPGTYTLYLQITDPVSGFPICLANDTDSQERGCALGALSIRKLAQ